MGPSRGFPASRLLLVGYFAVLMLAGGLLLRVLPVTGLITVSTASYTLSGQIIILVLIQLGGLGVIAFSTLYRTRPGRRLSLQRRAVIREYFVGSVEYEPRTIVRRIVLTTFGIEAVLALILTASFLRVRAERPLFTGIFHAISSLCNAGFSTFPDSLERYVSTPVVTLHGKAERHYN